MSRETQYAFDWRDTKKRKRQKTKWLKTYREALAESHCISKKYRGASVAIQAIDQREAG